MLTLEITNIKNMRLFLEVAEQLGYEGDKVQLVLNRADSALGIRVADVENSIGRKIDDTIVSDGRSVVYALNRGVPVLPLATGRPRCRQDVLRLARHAGRRPRRRPERRPPRPPRRSPCSRGDDVTSRICPSGREGV